MCGLPYPTLVTERGILLGRDAKLVTGVSRASLLRRMSYFQTRSILLSIVSDKLPVKPQ